MCRLTAMVGVDTMGSMRRLIFNQAMLFSVIDGNNMHGAGVSDGFNTYKSGRSYAECGQVWLSMLDPDRMWIGHARRPSKGVAGADTQASHPFVYQIADKGLMTATHNGFITETSGDDNGPLSDSFRAIGGLAEILRDGRDMSINTIDRWTADFGPESEWAFMIYYQDDLWIIRGNRGMFFLPVAHGFIFNTSEDVLINLKYWISHFWPSTNVGLINEVKDWHAVRISQSNTRCLDIKTIKNTYTRYADPTNYYLAHEGGSIQYRALPDRNP